MKIGWSSTLNFLILFAAIMLFAGFQSTFWFQLFGNTPAPLLWLNLMVYIMLYRKPISAIILVYALGITLLTFTIIPLKMLWLTLLVVFGLVYLIKTRVFWSGSGYYTIMCAFSAVTFHLVYFFASMFIEKNPASFEILDRLIQIVLTPTFAFPVYWVFSKIDKYSQDELVHESGGLDL